MKVLCNVKNNIEATMVQELLMNDGIVSSTITLGVGIAYSSSGLTPAGIKIEVSSEDYEKAKELLDAYFSANISRYPSSLNQ